MTESRDDGLSHDLSLPDNKADTARWPLELSMNLREVFTEPG